MAAENPVQTYQPPVEDDEIDLREIIDLLKAGRWTILACVVGALFLGVCYVLLARPVYDVNGTVQVDQGDKSGSLSNSLGSIGSLLGAGSSQADAEMQIIQSRLVLEGMINKLGLQVQAQPHYFPLIGRRIAQWNKGNGKVAGAPPLLGKYAWGGEFIDVSAFSIDTTPYTAEGGFLYDKPWSLLAKGSGAYALFDPAGDLVLSGRAGQPAHGIVNGVNISLTVQSLTARAGETFRIVRHSLPMLLKDVSQHLSVSQLGGSGTSQQSGVIQIGYSGHDRARIAQIVDTIEKVYLAQDVKKQTTKAQQSLSFLEAQLPDLKKKVDDAQAALASYQQANGAADVAAQTGLLLKQSVALETQRQSLIQQKQLALQRFTPEHPVVQALNRQIALVAADQSALAKKIDGLPSTQQNVLSLLRDVDVTTQLYTTMLDAIQQFQVTKAGTVGGARIVDAALQPLNPDEPKKGLVLVLSIFLGAFLGTAWVFMRRMLLRGVDDPAQVERHTGLSVLASIPYVREQKKIFQLISRGTRGAHLLAVEDADSPAVEALRSLRTSLHFATLDARNNIIAFSGPAPGIGKSFIATNFGAMLAGAGKRTVLVDADLRKGYLHRYFGQDEQPGLSDYVAGDLQVTSVIRQSGVLNGLDVIGRGRIPPNPAELLMHPRFEALLTTLSQQYDYVLLDTPPILAVTDAAIVARHAGTTLLVLKSAEHPLREIEESIKRFSSSGVKVSGVLMNQVGARAGAYGYGGYGYNSYRYTDS